MAHDVRQWLEDIELGEFADAFAEQNIEFQVLSELGDEDLSALGLSLGQRRKFLHVARQLATRNYASPAAPAANEAGAERRQLTIMFCDLVGSTALSRELDPEDLREVMRSYQDAVVAVLNDHDGHVAKFLGDGVLAYFGWPQAHEDQAARAVRAGLQTVKAVSAVKFGSGKALAARVGIATGEVIVGDLVGEGTLDREAVIGETPNLAARLQQAAAPGQVIIGAETRELIVQAFMLEDLGSQDLKGFDAAQAWRVVGERSVESRFEAAHGTPATRFVGRAEELERLSGLWALAVAGRGQTALISGEAGIGKSRLMLEFRKSLDGQPCRYLSFQCSSQHLDSPYHPIIEGLQRQAAFAPGDGDDGKLDKLETLLASLTAEVDRIAPLFAALLSLPGERRYGPLELTPESRNRMTIDAFVLYIQAAAAQQPVLFLFEDAHWADPTTIIAAPWSFTGSPPIAPPRRRWRSYSPVSSKCCSFCVISGPSLNSPNATCRGWSGWAKPANSR